MRTPEKSAAPGLKEKDLIRYAVNQAGVFTFIEVLNKPIIKITPINSCATAEHASKEKLLNTLPKASFLVIEDEDGHCIPSQLYEQCGGTG